MDVEQIIRFAFRRTRSNR